MRRMLPVLDRAGARKPTAAGTIDERLLFTQAAVAQLRQFASIGGGGGQDFEPLSEKQARDGAQTMGRGVTYVSSTVINTSEGVGRDIKYAFTDINQLSLDTAPPRHLAASVGSSGAEYGRARPRRRVQADPPQADGHALLTIVVPQLPAPSARLQTRHRPPRISPSANQIPRC